MNNVLLNSRYAKIVSEVLLKMVQGLYDCLLCSCCPIHVDMTC